MALRVPRTSIVLRLAPLLLALAGCRGPSADSAATARAGDKTADSKEKVAVQIAQRKLDQAKLELAVEEKKGAAAIAQAERELALASTELSRFDATGAPQQLRKAELGLLRAQDELQENTEELAQLELMYAEQDLADKTRDLVIGRTRRRLERAQTELELERGAVEELRGFELAQARAKLELEVQEKQAALDVARLETRGTYNEKVTAIMEAQAALKAAEEKAAKKDKKEAAKKDGDKKGGDEEDEEADEEMDGDADDEKE